MPQYIEEFRQKLYDKQNALDQQENKKREMMEEAREYFGYDVDPNDPRFIRMQEAKREAEKNLMKKKKKESKAAQYQETLRRMHEEAQKAREQLAERLKKEENK